MIEKLFSRLSSEFFVISLTFPSYLLPLQIWLFFNLCSNFIYVLKQKIMRIHQLKMLILLKNNFDGLEWKTKNIWYILLLQKLYLIKVFLLIIEFLLFFPGKLPVPLKSYWTQSTKSPLTFPAHLANKPWIRKNVNLSSIPKGFPIPSKSSSEMDSKSIHLLFTPLSGFHYIVRIFLFITLLNLLLIKVGFEVWFRGMCIKFKIEMELESFKNFNWVGRSLFPNSYVQTKIRHLQFLSEKNQIRLSITR